jgi:integrase
MSAALQTLRGFAHQALGAQIISSVRADDGTEHVLSRYGDAVWDLSPFCKVKSLPKNRMQIRWPAGLPPFLLASLKAGVYAYWRLGYPRRKRPESATVIYFAKELARFACWLNAQGIARFAAVSPSIAQAYAAHCRSSRSRQGAGPDPLSVTTLTRRLAPVEALYAMRAWLDDARPAHPWPAESAASMAGYQPSHGPPRAKTPVIPDDIAAQLFQKAERLLSRAEALLDARDALDDRAKRYTGRSRRHLNYLLSRLLQSRGLPALRGFHRSLSELRTACYLTIGMLSGMRDHEINSLKADAAYYETSKDGEVYGWLRGESHKTFAGACEWMVPPLAGRAVAVAARLTAPLRSRLKARIEELEKLLADAAIDPGMHRDAVAELQESRRHQDQLFLGYDYDNGVVRNLTGLTWRGELKAFAAELGWNLRPHQLRRTFAVFVAHHIMGNLRYLRHHFKHWSMDMTLLYGMHEKRDLALYESIMSSINEHRVDLVSHWLDEDVALAGGASQRIREYRAAASSPRTSLTRSPCAVPDTPGAWRKDRDVVAQVSTR